MYRRSFAIIIPLILLVGLGSAMIRKNGKERNLQILPKDISDEKLDSIMQTYNLALGVKCNFCHTAMPGFPDSLDYASDASPMKADARKMMRMTIELNSKYFYFDSATRPEYLKVITCKTCHRGEPFPPED